MDRLTYKKGKACLSKIIKLTLLTIVLGTPIYGASIYYVDSTNGNDSNPGTQTQPWKTIAKVNGFAFAPGDTVSFNCGQTWREALNIRRRGDSTHPLVFNSYGTGAKPRILGSDQLTNWTVYSGNIWRCSHAGIVSSVWFINASNGKTKWGDKKTSKAACIAEYDWYSDGSSVWCFAATDPDTRYTSVEAAVETRVVDIADSDYITISGLELAFGTQNGIYQRGAWQRVGLKVSNCTIHHFGIAPGNDGNGITIQGNNATIEDNTIHNCSRHAVYLYLNNPGITMTGCVIQRNTVYNCYHSGIDLMDSDTGAMTGNIVRYNFVYTDSDYADPSLSMQGISVGNGTHYQTASIYYNVILQPMASGIYIGPYNSGTMVYNNVICGTNPLSALTSSGIWVKDGNRGIVIKNNIVLDSADACLKVDRVGNISSCDYNCYFQSAGGTARYVTTGMGPYNSYQYDDFGQYKTDTRWDTHGRWEDPKFVNASSQNFHLQSSSPNIDAGQNLGLTRDFYGNSVPSGARADIGVHEYDVTGTALSASASASPVSGQAPLSVSFTGNASGGTSPYSYSWAFGDGGSSAAQNPSHTYSSAGTFSATLTVTDSASAIASKSVTITVSSTTGELVAAASADPIGGPTPLSVSFSGSASGGTAPYSYSWDFGDGTTSAAQNPGHVYSALGNYTAILTVTDNLAARADAVVNISVVSDGTAVLGLSAETGAPAPGEGGTTNPTPGNHFYSIGSTVAVDSIPNTDYRFSKWTGDVPDESMFSAETTITLNTSKPLLSTFCTKCADVNGDLKITPSDAQLAFDLYLGKIPSPTWCELENADVNCSGTKSAPQITPADAQTIFNKYLQKKTGSSDCSGSSRAAAASQQSVSFFNGPFLIDISFLTSEGDILIPVIVESPTEMGAFGFDLSFPSDTWTYVGLEATDLTADCNQLAGNVISNEASGPYGSTASVPSSQFLRVGGFRTSDAKNASVGVLVTLVFKTKTGFTGPSEISVIATYDDLRNTLIYAGTSGRLRDTERGIENGRPADQRKVKAISR